MSVKFEWAKRPDGFAATQEDVESILTDMIRDFPGDSQPCHSGDVTIKVGIEGPLESELTGVACCSCGKVYVRFHGDERASYLKIDEP